MSGLKTLSAAPASPLKTNVPVASIASPRLAPKVFGGSSMIPEPVRLFAFGEQGTGKTFMIKQLLEAGFKVYYISTDIGGSGLSSFTGQIEDKYFNDETFRAMEPFREFADLRSFMFNPRKFDPDIYSWDPDFVFWDGFSSYQQFILNVEVMGGEFTKVSDLQVEGKEWGPIKNGTLGMLDKFMALNNPTNGKIWHKIVTCHEDVRNQGGGLGAVVNLGGDPQGVAWIQGAARQAITGAFDVILHTRVDKEAGFVYDLTKPLNQQPKYRGKVLKDLPKYVAADIIPIVDFQFTSRKITRGMCDPKQVVGVVE